MPVVNHDSRLYLYEDEEDARRDRILYGMIGSIPLACTRADVVIDAINYKIIHLKDGEHTPIAPLLNHRDNNVNFKKIS